MQSIGKEKSMFKKIRNGFNTLGNKVSSAAVKAKLAVENVKAEGYVDSGVKILIAVVIGALLLGGLYALFNTNIMPTVTRKVTELFNYKGH